jgi:hypothetical protein
MVPQLGDIACLQITGQVGELIRVGQWLCGDGFRNFEHCEIYVGLPDEKGPLGYTLGAYPGGADLVAVPEDQGGWLWSTGQVNLTDPQRGKIVEAALALKGTPYSALDYFAIAAHRLRIPDPDDELQKYIGDTKSMICSQLCDWCYLQGGVHLFNDGRWPGYVTPEDIANVISHPESIQYGKAKLARPPMRMPG